MEKYYFDDNKKDEMWKALESQGISPKRIVVIDSTKFYDLKHKVALFLHLMSMGNPYLPTLVYDWGGIFNVEK